MRKIIREEKIARAYDLLSSPLFLSLSHSLSLFCTPRTYDILVSTYLCLLRHFKIQSLHLLFQKLYFSFLAFEIHGNYQQLKNLSKICRSERIEKIEKIERIEKIENEGNKRNEGDAKSERMKATKIRYSHFEHPACVR